MDVGVHTYSPRMQEAEARGMRVSNRLHSVSEANISCSIGSRPQPKKKTKQEEGEGEGGKSCLNTSMTSFALGLFTSHKAARCTGP